MVKYEKMRKIIRVQVSFKVLIDFYGITDKKFRFFVIRI